MTSWLTGDPATWSWIIAGYSQNCPDGCGRGIEFGSTKITDVSGVWRRLDCVTEQWWAFRESERRGTQAELIAAIKRVTANRDGHVIVRGFEADGPRAGRLIWIEVSYV